MGLKKNIFYSAFLTTSNYLFQFITYPYVARVLGVSGIGTCNFVQSIVCYFMLFSTLGLITLGTREVAKCGNDKEKLNKVFSSLFEMHLTTTLFVSLIYVVLLLTVDALIPYRKLLCIGLFQILFDTLTLEWLFRGLEDFKYITLRNFCVKLAYVVAIFLFIREASDYWIYFLISVLVYVVNGLINFRYSRKFVRFSIQPLRVIRPLIKPFLVLGLYVILRDMYTSFNVMILGFFTNDIQVGYYTTATKIQNILLALYSSFSLVLMPRVSSMMAQHDLKSIQDTLRKSMSILYIFAFPLIYLSVIYAPTIINIIVGPGYESSILLFRIAMPLILVIGLEQIFIVQFLLPIGADKAVFVNASIGAIVAIVLNLTLVPHLQSLGSVLVWSTAEISVLLSAYYFVRRDYGRLLDLRELFKNALVFLPIIPLSFCLRIFIENQYVSFLISAVCTVAYCHFSIYHVLKNELYRNLIGKILSYRS